MQQDNYIKNKLQQMDNQQLPDLSHMDEHWKQMQAALVPADTAPAKAFPKTALWIIGAAIIITAVVLMNKYGANKNAEPAHASADKKQQTIVTTASLPAMIPVDSPQTKPSTSRNFILNLGPDKRVIKTNSNDPVDATTGLIDGNQLSSPVPVSKQFLLEELFNGLAKKAQEFTIDNSKDTLLAGSEGGALFIPAKSLNNGPVTISIKEYYSKSDMVLNKLYTKSNAVQLVSGGMIHITASADGKEIQPSKQNPLKWFLPDTNTAMRDMQLFNGETKGTINLVSSHDTSFASYGVNWIPEPQYFSSTSTITQVWVLDIRNEPYRIINRRKGATAIFNIVNDPKLNREQLKTILKEKYGYKKVRFGLKENSFFHKKHRRFSNYEDNNITYISGTRGDSAVPLEHRVTYSINPIGDSVWMEKSTADKYKIPYEKQRLMFYNSNSSNASVISAANNGIFKRIRSQYSIDITSLGWVNCDRFYYDPRKKMDFMIDLGDTASNYYTVLVFDKLKSVLNGNTNGSKILFYNLPEGEPVTIISIGIGTANKPMMAMKHAVVSNNELTGLQFETTDQPALKASLSKIDK